MIDDVTQADRCAVKRHQQRFLTEGQSETVLLAKAFARHRQAAEQATVDKIVAWLRGLPCCSDGSQTAWVADAIQSGEWKR